MEVEEDATGYLVQLADAVVKTLGVAEHDEDQRALMVVEARELVERIQVALVAIEVAGVLTPRRSRRRTAPMGEKTAGQGACGLGGARLYPSVGRLPLSGSVDRLEPPGGNTDDQARVDR